MQLFNKAKHFRFGNARARAKRAPSSVENACQTEPLPATANQSGTQADSISINSDRWEEFCRKYEQQPNNLQSNLLSSVSMSTIRTTHFDNLLYHTAKLHEHHWTLLSQNEKYKSLCTPQQWDLIQQDLELYSKAIQSLGRWLQYSSANLDLDEMNPQHQDLPCIQELREGLSIAQLQKPENKMSLQEENSQEQGGLKGWVSRIVATIVMMMGSREITPFMTKGIIGLAVVIATTVYAMHLVLVVWLYWTNEM